MLKTLFKSIFNFEEYDLKHYNVSILAIITLLGSIGMVLIRRLQESDERQFEKQIIGYAVGLIIAVVVSMIDYHFVAKFFIPLYLLNIALLVITKFTPLGKSHYTAKRWIAIGSQEVQPSELTRIIMIIFLAKFFDIVRRQINKISIILLALILMVLPISLIIIQPDLSVSIVLFATFISMFFMAGLSYKIILPTLAIGIPSFIAFFWYVQQDYQVILTEYQRTRILAMLHPEQFPEQAYQQLNAAKCIRAGGVSGKLLSDADATLRSAKVPVIESDFIFTAIAEAFGFIGSLIVIILLMIFIYKALKIARMAKDFMGMLIASGIASLTMFQLFVNIGVVTSLLPNTGIPLPFVSSGLSALLGNMLMVGVLLNVSLQNKRMLPQKETLSL